MSQTRCGSGVTARLRHWVGLLAYIFKILSKFKVVFIKVLPRAFSFQYGAPCPP
jgi:hypothetical protein